MERIKLNDKTFHKVLAKETIVEKIEALADKINSDYAACTTPPIIVGMLNGAYMFCSELTQRLNFNCEITFLKMQSYVGTESSGCVSQLIGLERDITNRDIIIVEDIVETGTTICAAWEMLKKGNPRSVKIATMMFKPESYHIEHIPIDYYAMEIPGNFIVGFGLDYDGLGRNLPDIYALMED